MLEFPHMIVGAAIAYKLKNPFLAIPLSFGSHFLLDKIPHWNPHLNTEMKKFGKVTQKSLVVITIDAVLSIVGCMLIALKAMPDRLLFSTVLAGGVCGVLPDIIEAPYYILNIKNNFIEKKWIPFQKSIQEDAPIVFGLFTQALVLIAAFWWVGI